MSRNLKLLAAGLWLVTGMFAALADGEAQFVKITSPASGIVVHPGDRFTMTVDATPFAFHGILLSPFAGWSTSGPPYRITVEIPTDSSSGVQGLTAMGVPPSGLKGVGEKDITADSIELDIERSDSPKKLDVQLLDHYNVEGPFSKGGETRGLLVTGVFANDTKVFLTVSKLTTYESSDPSVATVTDHGVITSIGPGAATITIKNGNATAAILITVPDKH